MIWTRICGHPSRRSRQSFARRNGESEGKPSGCITARYGRPATDCLIHGQQSGSMRSISCCFWLLRSGRHHILCSNGWPNWGRAMPCCWTAVVLPQSPSAKVLGMLLRDRCSEARVRSRLFSELGRADLALRKAVEWRFRFALEHSSIRPVASVVLSYSVEHLKNAAARPRARRAGWRTLSSSSVEQRKHGSRRTDAAAAQMLPEHAAIGPGRRCP